MQLEADPCDVSDDSSDSAASSNSSYAFSDSSSSTDDCDESPTDIILVCTENYSLINETWSVFLHHPNGTVEEVNYCKGISTIRLCQKRCNFETDKIVF